MFDKLKDTQPVVSWSAEDGEGEFISSFFRNEDDNKLLLFAKRDLSDYKQCAEKCVIAFNSLPDSVIDEICEKLIACAKDGGIAEDFRLPHIDNPREIMKYCWFYSLYVNMKDKDDVVSYAVSGEGDWGEEVGFFVRNDTVEYVGTDFFDYLD